MAIDYDAQEYIAALGNIGSGLNNKPGESFGVVDNLNNINRSFGNPFISSFTPTTDPTFTSGLNYARSIAGGQNIPNMIAPGVSYSAANPQGFTQLDLPPIVSGTPEVVTETPPDDPSYFGTGIGGVNIPVDRKQDLPPRDIFSLLNIGKLFDGTFDFSNFDFGTTPDLPPNIQETIPVIPPKPPSIGGVGGRDIEDRILIDERIGMPPKQNDQLFIDDMPRFIEEEVFIPKEVIQAPVDMPAPVNVGGLVDLPQINAPSITPFVPKQKDQIFIDDRPNFIEEELFTPPVTIPEPVSIPEPVMIPEPISIPEPVIIPEPVMIPKAPIQKDQLFIDDIPRFEDIPSTEYVVPEVPLNNLLNQSPPQRPVGMTPQETAKVSSQQELLNLISNKDILQEIPADDGVRNQYQVELDEYINKSPINMDTYKEELPVGSTINLGIPAVMETVVPMAVPGLSLATNISNSLSSNNNLSPAPRPSSPSVSRPSSSGIDYSSVRRFGR